MRKWSWVLGAFLTVAGCEDSQPKQKEAPIVKMEMPPPIKMVETPKIEPIKVEETKPESPSRNTTRR